MKRLRHFQKETLHLAASIIRDAFFLKLIAYAHVITIGYLD